MLSKPNSVPLVQRRPQRSWLPLLRRGLGASWGVTLLAIAGGLPLIEGLTPSPVQASTLDSWNFDPFTNHLKVRVKEGIQPRYFFKAKPARIVLELPNTDLGSVKIHEANYIGTPIKQIRITESETGSTQIVMELAPKVRLGKPQVEFQRESELQGGLAQWVLRPIIVDPNAIQSPPNPNLVTKRAYPPEAPVPGSPAPAQPSAPAQPPAPAALGPKLATQPVVTTASQPAVQPAAQPETQPKTQPKTQPVTQPSQRLDPKPELKPVPPPTPEAIATPTPSVTIPVAPPLTLGDRPGPQQAVPPVVVPVVPPLVQPAIAFTQQSPSLAGVDLELPSGLVRPDRSAFVKVPQIQPLRPSSSPTGSGPEMLPAGLGPRPQPESATPRLAHLESPIPKGPIPSRTIPDSAAIPDSAIPSGAIPSGVGMPLISVPTLSTASAVPPLNVAATQSGDALPQPPKPATSIRVSPGLPTSLELQPLSLGTLPQPVAIANPGISASPSSELTPFAPQSTPEPTALPTPVLSPVLTPGAPEPGTSALPSPLSSTRPPALSPVTFAPAPPRRTAPLADTEIPIIQFGQPLPLLGSAGMLSAGSIVNLRYPGVAALNLKPGMTTDLVALVVDSAVQDATGQVLLPSGSVVYGQFQSTRQGSRFVAQSVVWEGRSRPIVGESELLDGPRQVSEDKLLKLSGLGALAGAVVGDFSGGSIVGGAAAGAAASYLTAPKIATIQPGQVIPLRLQVEWR